MRWPQGIFYGWSMVAVAALPMAVGVGLLWSGLEVWEPVLECTVGWFTRWRIGLTEVLLLAILATLLVGAPLALVEGMLVDKLGPRRMVFIGLIMLGFGLALGSQPPSGVAFRAS